MLPASLVLVTLLSASRHPLLSAPRLRHALRTLPPQLSEASQREAKKNTFDRPEIRAKLVICVNTNICGKPNPTHVPGYGFAYKAIDAISVLGPQWLGLRPGPCFVRCSSGVNARMIGNKTAYAALGLPNLRARDLFRLNSIDDCIQMLRDELEWEVDPVLLAAYRAYAEAVLLLDDNTPSETSMTSRAATALPLLDVAANYALEQSRGIFDETAPVLSSFARVSTEIAKTRQGWAGARWRESFYGSELRFVDGSFLGEAEVGAAYGKKRYGKGEVGSLRGTVSGADFRGKWREEQDGDGVEAVGGDVALRMSADGLSFEGSARVDGEAMSWSGARIVEPPPEARPENIDPRRRWYALVLILRCQAKLLLSQRDGTMSDAVGAACLCMYLPEAWEAISDVALKDGDKRTAAIALSELWALQPQGSAGMPPSLANRRRELGMELEKLQQRTGGQASSGRISIDGGGAWAQSPKAEAAARARAAEDDRVAKAIFVDEYALPMPDEEAVE